MEHDMALTDDGKDRGKIVVKIDPDLEELIPGYLQNRTKDVQDVQELLNNADFDSIQRMGHTMKGSGGGYGFDFISAIGMSLEEASKEKDVHKIQNSLKDLCDFLERVKVVYK
jgi:HPt (histidine-containing phosphotransfer) domain-containing protein